MWLIRRCYLRDPKWFDSIYCSDTIERNRRHQYPIPRYDWSHAPMSMRYMCCSSSLFSCVPVFQNNLCWTWSILEDPNRCLRRAVGCQPFRRKTTISCDYYSHCHDCWIPNQCAAHLLRSTHYHFHVSRHHFHGLHRRPRHSNDSVWHNRCIQKLIFHCNVYGCYTIRTIDNWSTNISSCSVHCIHVLAGIYMFWLSTGLGVRSTAITDEYVNLMDFLMRFRFEHTSANALGCSSHEPSLYKFEGEKTQNIIIIINVPNMNGPEAK